MFFWDTVYNVYLPTWSYYQCLNYGGGAREPEVLVLRWASLDAAENGVIEDLALAP